MKLKILGTGCPTCKVLEEKTKEAIKQLQIEAEIEKITDIDEIMEYGVMSTPALVKDDEVLVYGRVPEIEEIKSMLTK